jgi:threonine aldolase
MRFLSDNTATICPEILTAIVEANQGLTPPYGDDAWTHRLSEAFSKFFDTDVQAFAVSTGTAANGLSIASLVPPYGAVYAHEQAHIFSGECGAPEFYSGGAKVIPLGGHPSKLLADALAQALRNSSASVHAVQPRAVSVSQVSDLGTVYRPSEIAALSDVAHAHGLKVHMDGARFANAVAFLGCHPGDITWRAGVDVLSFGATKNGALAAEAVVFFDRSLAHDFGWRRKRAGHLLSKSRFVAAQLLAYIESGVWLRNAQRANSLAQRIAAAAGSHLLHPVEANQIFARFSPEEARTLRAAGFEFYDFGPRDSGQARLVVSWDQRDEDVEALCEALRRLGENGARVD